MVKSWELLSAVAWAAIVGLSFADAEEVKPATLIGIMTAIGLVLLFIYDMVKRWRK